MTVTENQVSKRGTMWSTVPASTTARRSTNPIRMVLEKMDAMRATLSATTERKDSPPSPAPLKLSLGDPTVFGNLDTHPAVTEAVSRQLHSCRANGYGPGHGFEVARAAIAQKYSRPEAPLTAEDVILTSSCSGALDLVFTCMAEPGQNILLPNPCFSLYNTQCHAKGIQVREYRLLPQCNWEADLDHMASLIDKNTAAILINNPSNPCGSVFTKDHLLAILAICEQYHVPLIADEIYADIVFGNYPTTDPDVATPVQFHPVATLTTTVPVLSVGGLAKQWLVPGWRLGWITIHDRNQLFAEVRRGLHALTMLILGPNTMVQKALPDIFANVPASHLENLVQTLHRHAQICQKYLECVPGLKVIMPQGAMYMMVSADPTQFHEIEDDVDFASRLNVEEAVELLPGQCFNYRNYLRITLTPPPEVLTEACQRIARFCARYYRA
ncbi:hypothetical protein H4R34_000464 [Dimargaris verticillata]|uniref:Tyrosine aminotransferase n=1 Tax=Dimargaris verticillata TaxID=2761393 RepID=A0A9W8B6N7_9FUNG|nr:hypothetical protein H4R34_000464 [Dimargaris verticillata]